MRYRTHTHTMKQEYEFWQNLFVAIMVVGIFLAAGSGTTVTAVTAVILIIAGLAGTALFEKLIDEEEKEMTVEDLARIKRKIDQLDRYSFNAYLNDHGRTIEELATLINEYENPKALAEAAYKDYRRAAGTRVTETKERVFTMISKARMRADRIKKKY